MNAMDYWGFSALHEVVQKGCTQLCALLLNHGADMAQKNQQAQTPHSLAQVGKQT